jgi:spoIIIJ-associated protein
MKKEDLEKIAQDFFKYFDAEAQIEVSDHDGWWVKVTSPGSGHLIGKMGETLNEIQYLIRLIVAQSAGEFIPVTVDVDGYKEKKQNELVELALAMAENVKTSGYPQEMRPMSAYSRRLVHVALKDIEGIKSDSIGEGELRRIEIKPAE